MMLRERFLLGDKVDLTGEVTLRRGTLKDYGALSEHHYRAARPATATRVLVLEHGRLTAVGRYLQRKGERQRVGVLVESLPALSCRMRDVAMGGRYGGWLSPGQRALLLNDEVRCISRVVVEPSWRGLGLSVRLVRAALAEPTTAVTEALAAMGRVSPFFERAGMTAYPRPAHAFDARLTAALRSVGVSGVDLAMVDLVWRKIEGLDGVRRVWLCDELRRWARKNGGRGRGFEDDAKAHLRLAQERLMFEPVYYLRRH